MPDDKERLISGVDFVSVPTTNLAAAIEFYGDILGLPRAKLWQRPGHDPVGAEFETGTVTIALIDCEALGVEFQPNKVPIALRVDDVEAARAELESRGGLTAGFDTPRPSADQACRLPRYTDAYARLGTRSTATDLRR